jgi:23S rRNA (uridine2552-2'-O)-methyltransferase
MARRVLHDRFFKQAKSEGYLARSAYKLIEIDDKFRVLPRGGKVGLVLDLGAAPGSWTQVAAERMGDAGRVVALDIQAIRVSLKNATTLLADVNEVTPETLLAHTGGERFDAIVSDMAPNTSGHGDHFRSVRLCERALELARDVLKPGGNLVMKVFEGEAYPDLLKEASRRFAKCKGFKPQSSRDVSREMFIVALGFKDAAAAGG